MTKWVGKDIAKLLKGPDLTVILESEPGGDFDTCPITVGVNGTDDNLFVSGFITGDEVISDWYDVDVEMVELSDGLDSRGGLNSRNPKTIQAYADIRIKLAKEGFEIVDKMEDYF